MPEQYAITLPANGPTKAAWVNIVCDAENYEANKSYPIVDGNNDPVLDGEGNPTYGTYTKGQYALRKLHQINMSYLRKQHLKYLEQQAAISSEFEMDGAAT